MLRYVLILSALLFVLGGINGCRKDRESDSPDFTGTILAVNHPRVNSILLSVETSSDYVTDEIVIHTNGLVEFLKLKKGDVISVWLAGNKLIMQSDPPQAHADRIDVANQ